MQIALLLLFSSVLLLAAGHDLMRFRIPNLLVGVLLLLYPLWILASPGPQPWLASLGIFAVALLLALIAFRFGLLGAGDGKLLAATLLWAGPAHTAEVLMVMGLSGGVLALIYGTAMRYSAAAALERIGGEGLRDNLLGDRLPYGIAIAAGGLSFAIRALLTLH